MLLRHKFGLLALIYAASIFATVVTSLWCITISFQSAVATYEAQLELQNNVERFRLLVEAARGRPAAAANDASPGETLRALEATRRVLDVELTAPETARWWSDVRSALEAEQAAGAHSEAPPDDEETAVERTDDALARLARRLSEMRVARAEQLSSTYRQVVIVLSINAVGGAALCIAGVVLVLRWVARPVAALREATRRMGDGDFSHRIGAGSADELGMLSREVDQMCATIVSMQTRMIEQERLAAAGEVVTRLAHNIRNPLGGLRGLAEATLQRHGDDAQTAECQRRMIETVDRFESWLRDLQQSVAPMELQVQPSDIGDLLGGVIRVLQTVAERRSIRFAASVHPSARVVRLDPRHFEQALVALLTNAVQASPDGGRIAVMVEPYEELKGGWRMIIDDEGAGVPAEQREKVFQAYYTTKRDGHGLGLAMAAKVVKLHGGSISITDAPGGGARFVIVMLR